jgi:hypothetical protein
MQRCTSYWAGAMVVPHWTVGSGTDTQFDSLCPLTVTYWEKHALLAL